MVPLINKNDSFIIKESDFPGNAMFYKDMIAFCDAYTKVIGYGVKKLPNYCFLNNKLYLDGICLLIKDYSSEFDFETLDLSIEYLRVLYYAVASFSQNGNFPDSKTIESKYGDKRYTNKIQFQQIEKYEETAKRLYDDALNKFEIQASINDKKAKKVKNLSLISTIVFIIGILISAFFVVATIFDIIGMVISILVAVISLAVSVVLFVLGRLKLKKMKQELQEVEKETRYLIDDKNDKLSKLKDLIDQKAKINNEIYNFIYCVTNMDLMNDNTDYNELLEKATAFNMLSYNLEYDVANTFASHDEDIKEMVEKIENLSKENLYSGLNQCYKEILHKNWLYHNRYVRYAFIEKMLVSAKLTHNWQVCISGNYKNPFDIDIKSIANEKVAFLENQESFLVEMPVNRLLKVNFIKSDKSLKINSNSDEVEIKNIKMTYANKFYNLAEARKLNGFFYTDNVSKTSKKKNLDLFLLEGKNIIPDVFLIKIKLIEAKKRYENSHLDEIVKLNEMITQKIENQGDEDILLDMSLLDLQASLGMDSLDFNDLISNNIGCENIEEFVNGCVRYTFNGKKMTGYKL